MLGYCVTKPVLQWPVFLPVLFLLTPFYLNQGEKTSRKAGHNKETNR